MFLLFSNKFSDGFWWIISKWQLNVSCGWQIFSIGVLALVRRVLSHRNTLTLTIKSRNYCTCMCSLTLKFQNKINKQNTVHKFDNPCIAAIPLFCCAIFNAMFSCLRRALSFWSFRITSIAFLNTPALFICDNRIATLKTFKIDQQLCWILLCILQLHFLRYQNNLKEFLAEAKCHVRLATNYLSQGFVTFITNIMMPITQNRLEAKTPNASKSGHIMIFPSMRFSLLHLCCVQLRKRMKRY